MIQFVYKRNGLAATEASEAIVEQKYHSLSKYWSESAVVRCEIEFEKVGAKQSGMIHRVEANLMVDGTLYRAEATEETFEKAVDEVRNELDKELRRSKKRGETLFRKGGRMLKSLLRKN